MPMETITDTKKEQWKAPTSPASSSRSSSITSDSSDGHFNLRHFPLPKPSLSASEVQKQRETHQAYSSSLGSYTGSSWSSLHQNNLIDLPGYDPNRIPSSVFSSKPANSAEWSVASNDSLFSIHDGNFYIMREDNGFSGTFKSSEMPKLEETVHEITEINAVPFPSAKKPNQSEKETIVEEKSDSEVDDNDVEIKEEEIIEVESEDEHDVKEVDTIEKAAGLVQIETKKPEETEIVEDAKESKPDDSNSIVLNSPSVSCRSDTSNNSVSSFAFPVFKNDDGVSKMPMMNFRNNMSHKREPEYLLPQSPMHFTEPQPQPQLEPQSQPQPERMSSKNSEPQTQSPKASRCNLLYCFHFRKKCGLFK